MGGSAGAEADGGRAGRRTEAGGRFRLVRGANALLLTLLVAGILVLVNVVAARFPLRLDLSADRRFQLSPQTREVLGRLEQDVKVYAFLVGQGGENERIEDLLREYRVASPRVRVQVVDPEKQPSRAREMDVRQAGTLVVEMGNQRRKIEFFNLFVPGPEGTEFRGEQAVTRAIMDLVGYGQATIYFLEGHGEGSPQDEFSELRSYLEGEGFTVRTVNLALHNRIPDDARVLVLGGPRRDLDPREREMLEGFAEKGGRLAIWLDPLPGGGLPELERLLLTLGVKTVPGVVVDPARAFFGDALSPVPDLRWHPITRPLIQANSGVVLPGARALSAVERDAEALPSSGGDASAGEGRGADRQVVPLLMTTDRAWAETNPQGRQWRRDTEDAAGPLTLALAVAHSQPAPRPASTDAPGAASADGADDAAETGEATVEVPVAVVVGSSAFARNASLAFQGNRDLAANMLTWLAGEQALVTIRPRVTPVPRVLLTAREVAAIFYGSTVGIPLVILAAGLAVWWRRRGL